MEEEGQRPFREEGSNPNTNLGERVLEQPFSPPVSQSLKVSLHVQCTSILSLVTVWLICMGFWTASMPAKAAEANGKETKSIPSAWAAAMIF